MATDRDRLKDVHATDLTESNVNEEFVDWLKTKGMTYLLMFLVVIVVYLYWGNFKERKFNDEAQAYAQLSATQLPSSLEEIADENDSIGEVQLLARLKAARNRLRAVRSGVRVTAIQALATAPETITEADRLTEADREQYLAAADKAFEEVAKQANTPELTLFAVGALNGRAAAAESRGNVEEAVQYYKQAAERAGTLFPALATNALKLAESAGDFGTAFEFPSADDVDALRSSYQPERLLPSPAVPALDSIIDPDDSTDSE